MKAIKVTLERVFGFTEALSGGDRYTCFKTLDDGRTMQIWFPHSDAVWNPKVISLSIYEDCDHSNYYREDYFKAFDKTIIGNMPKNMFGKNAGQVFSLIKKSKRVLPNSGKDMIELDDGRTVSINDYFDEKWNDLKKRISKIKETNEDLRIENHELRQYLPIVDGVKCLIEMLTLKNMKFLDLNKFK